VSVPHEDHYDTVVVGAGLGGMSCAAALARAGQRVLVLERGPQPGGYLQHFGCPGGFRFEASLHFTELQDGEGRVGGFAALDALELCQPPGLMRILLPGRDIRVPQRDPAAYQAMLAREFPGEAGGLEALFDELRAAARDYDALEHALARGATPPPASALLRRCQDLSWAGMMGSRVRDPELRTILSTLWFSHGLPPERMAALYYGIPFIQTLERGSQVPAGGSAALVGALVEELEANGGTLHTGTAVQAILTEGGRVGGVRLACGRELRSDSVVSNASPPDTYGLLAGAPAAVAEGAAGLQRHRASLSTFQVFLGLDRDLVGELGIREGVVYLGEDYNLEACYRDMLRAEPGVGHLQVVIFDRLRPGCCPAGKNAISLFTLQGWAPWAPFAEPLRQGERTAYEEEKLAQELLLPGLSGCIEVQRIATPLTNQRFTGNTDGAAFGYDQTPESSGDRRPPHGTPLEGLYLVGAWTTPGHGVRGTIKSGASCCREILQRGAAEERRR
jgi:all-trans-retinol 13,14-reductase